VQYQKKAVSEHSEQHVTKDGLAVWFSV